MVNALQVQDQSMWEIFTGDFLNTPEFQFDAALQIIEAYYVFTEEPGMHLMLPPVEVLSSQLSHVPEEEWVSVEAQEVRSEFEEMGEPYGQATIEDMVDIRIEDSIPTFWEVEMEPWERFVAMVLHYYRLSYTYDTCQEPRDIYPQQGVW